MKSSETSAGINQVLTRSRGVEKGGGFNANNFMVQNEPIWLGENAYACVNYNENIPASTSYSLTTASALK